MRRRIFLFGAIALAVAAAGAPPQRIISMSPSATEILYGLGVIDRVVAVSDYDTWPPQVKTLPHIGGWSTPNLERVSALRPDLVVLSDAQNGLIGDQLRRFGVPVSVLPTQKLADVDRAIRIAATAVGREADGARLAAETNAQLDHVRSATKLLPHPLVLCIVDRTPGALRNVYLATGGSFLGELVELAGGRVAAPDTASGYAHVSNEQILALNPDIIIDIGQQPAAEAVWSEFPELNAVRHHRLVALNEDYISHPSQRVAETAALLVRIIHPEVHL
jgi:iron complex transport system substrate-binding protein